MLTLYVAAVDTTTRNPEDWEVLNWLDELVDWNPSLTTSLDRSMQVILEVPAETLRQACATALAIITSVNLTARSIQISTAQDWQARLSWHPIPELLSFHETAAMLGVSAQRVQQLAASGRLPALRVGSNRWAIPRPAVEQYRRK